MRLKTLLERLALQRKEDFPYPDDLESYVDDFVPNILLKSETLQQAFGITSFEMEQLYEEGYAFYQEGRYHHALNLFRWLVLFNPYVAKYWMGFAATQHLLKREEKALHAYAVAALLEPENPYPHYNAFLCYGGGEEGEKALKLALERCVGKYENLREEICLQSKQLERSL